MAFGGPEACGRSTRGRLPGSSYLDLPPKGSQYSTLWPTKGSSNPRDGLLDLFAYPRVWVNRP